MVDWSHWTSSLDRQAWWVGGGVASAYLCHNRTILTPGNIFSKSPPDFPTFQSFPQGRKKPKPLVHGNILHFALKYFSLLQKKVFQYFAMSKIVPPLVDGHLLLILVTDHEPDDSPKPPDQVEQGQHQPHHVHLGGDVV